MRHCVFNINGLDLLVEYKYNKGTKRYSYDQRAASSIKLVTCYKALFHVLEHIVIDFKGIEHKGELC